MRISDVLDSVLEGPVVPSFTKIGYLARKRTQGWRELDTYDMSGQVIVVTGATSGLGYAAATQMAKCGATLVLVGRTGEKNDKAVESIAEQTNNRNISQVPCDMGELEQVRALAAEVVARHDRLDTLVHNAGALSAKRREASSGIEATVASQVVGPFLLSALLLERLETTGGSRVLTMSSGGMYSAGLTISKLQMDESLYSGTEQYARAKRAQVTLNEMWADRFGERGVFFHSLHPGWADTPGVDDALPGFAKVVGPLLRSPEQGSDTLVWLAADDEPLESNGKFWHDRQQRSIHKLPTTRRTDTTERRIKLWNWVAQAAEVEI